MLSVFMFKSVRVGLVNLLPCYVKSVLLPSQREMCRGGTWQYGLVCVSSYSVFRVKGERRHYCLLLVCFATALADRDTHGRAVYGTRVLAFPASN